MCRNIYTGATTLVGGSIGGPGGKASTNPIQCKDGDGLTGFHTWNTTNLDKYSGYCRSAACGGGSCGLSTYEVGSNGKGSKGEQVSIADGAHLVNSISGAESTNKVVAQMGFNTLNFDVIAGYPNKYLNQGAICCIGQDSSGECNSAKNGGLDCRSVLQNYCSQGDRIFTDGICTTAINQNQLDPTWVMNQKKAFCSSNLTNSNCLDFCTSKTGKVTDQKNWCDQQWSVWAEKNPKDPLSSCLLPLNSSNYPLYEQYVKLNQSAGATADPRCFSSTCVQSGYQPGSDPHCPQCVQQQLVDVGANVTDTKLNNILQTCGGASSSSIPNASSSSNTPTSSSPSTSTPSSTPSSGATPSSTSQSSSDTNTFTKLWTDWRVDAVAGVFCCVCCLLLFYLVYAALSSNKTGGNLNLTSYA